jgi:heme-degrading monooxygenase HmoA
MIRSTAIAFVSGHHDTSLASFEPEYSMDGIAPEFKSPYYAVIFASLRTTGDEGYETMAARMEQLARDQPGFLGLESARNQDGTGITVSYWRTAEDVRVWKAHAEHQVAQALGRERWYDRFRVRVAIVEREYGFDREV